MRLLVPLIALMAILGQTAGQREGRAMFDRHLYAFMNESVVYSTPAVDTNYSSAAKFQPRGMGHLYNLTSGFLKLIQKKDPLPDGFLWVSEGRLQMAYLPTSWRNLLAHHGILAAVVGVAVGVAVLLPLVGLVFCCCRCSGRCGARAQPFDKRHDRCRRVFLGILLSVLTVAMMFGIVCSFVTNAFIQEGVIALPKEAKTSVNDTRLFLDNTKLEVSNLLINNYDQLELVLNDALSKSGMVVSEQLAEMSNATQLESLNTLVGGLESIQEDLSEIQSLTQELKGSYVELNEALTVAREGLLENLQTCNNTPACQTILREYNVSQLKTHADFNALLDRYFPKLPDISDQLNEMSGFKDISEGVTRGRAEYERVQTDVQSAVKESTDLLAEALVEAGNALKQLDKDMNTMLDNVRKAIVSDKVVNTLDDVDDLVKQYSPIRYYVYMTMNVLMLLVLICLIFGLFFGFCGRRPDGPYNDDCCTKATGAKFLMIAVWLVFVFGALLIALTLALMLTGVAAERGFCQPLRGPDASQLMSLVDRVVNLETVGPFPPGKAPNITVSQLISSCHANRSLYTVLALENVVNVSRVLDYDETQHIDERLRQLRDKIRFEQRVVLLDGRTRRDLDRLASSSLANVDFPAYTEQLALAVTSIDLMELARALNKTALDLRMNPSRPVPLSVPKYFTQQARSLETLQKTTVTRMQQQTRRLNDRARILEEHLSFGNQSLPAAVASLLTDLEGAQKYLDESMTTGIQEIARDFTTRFALHVKNYLTRVVSETKSNVGRCGPISNIYNSTLVATCDNVLRPFNGFWSSFGWCLLLCIPMIFLSVKLASLYQKSDPYQGEQTEAEYLYDAYANGDNIPLANVHDKKNHHRSYHETYDNGPGGLNYSAGTGGDYRGPAQQTQPSGARYTDMAPKHWDYPSAMPPGGGSPRYHSPPGLSTEYERPPPYYYPGPGEPGPR